MKLLASISLWIFAMSAAGATMKSDNSVIQDIERALDEFHGAASRADAKAYFDLFAPDGIFIGTDATERWTVEEFKAYAMPSFSKGKGWTYLPKNRHIQLAPQGDIVWFDEMLENKSYGTCRGTGVLRKVGNAWKISQYHLTIPVPNELAEKVVGMIQTRGSKPK
jgi:ketosteroid isomerase-like protein